MGKKIWQGAIYLSFAAIIIKILSALYRIVYQNIAGDVGFYVYQQIYPVYGAAIMLATYGFPVIISKLLLEQKYTTSRILINAFWGLFLVSLSICAYIYLSAPRIAAFMGDVELQLPLRIISFVFLTLPFLSVLRGYFQGREEMLPTAVSQIFEQFSRVTIILLLTYVLITKGFGPYAAGTGAAVGSLAGVFIGSLTLMLLYRSHSSRISLKHKGQLSFAIILKIIVSGIMICFSSLLLIILQFIDSVTILKVLVESGITVEAGKIVKGVYDRGQPLLQMGTVITTSFSLVIVPLIAKVHNQGSQELLQKYSSLAVKISLLIGAAASVGLMIVIEPANSMLFRDSTDSAVLAVLGIAIFFSAIVLTTSAILHGLDKLHCTVVHVFIAFLLKLFLNLMLVPEFETMGAAMATVAATAACASLNIYQLRKTRVLLKISIAQGGRVVASLAAMVIVTLLWKEGCQLFMGEGVNTRLENTIIAISSVFVAILTFLIAVITTKLFSEEELQYIPKVNKLIRFLTFKKKQKLN